MVFVISCPDEDYIGVYPNYETVRAYSDMVSPLTVYASQHENLTEAEEFAKMLQMKTPWMTIELHNEETIQ